MARPDAERCVVTGMGAVSALGWGADALWTALRDGRCGIGEFDVFDAAGHRTQVAAQAPEAPAEVAAGLPSRRSARSCRFALASVREALAGAGLEPGGAWGARAGVFFGSSTGGMLEGETFFAGLPPEGRRPRGLTRLGGQQNNAPGDAVARAAGVRGPVETTSAACAAAAMAVGIGLRSLRSGEVDTALVGGADELCRLTYAGFNSLRAVDERPTRPFRADREGLSLGDGGAVLVIERLETARARGATPLAEVLGGSFTCDAHHMTAPHPEGDGAARAIRAALDDAGIGPGDVDFVNAHGTGTPHNDAAEWAALRSVFGDRAGAVPVTSTKGALGHTLGASGALEAVATVACLRAGEIHPTPGDGPVDPETPVDLVLGEARRPERCRVGLSVNLAFGGANAASVFAAWEDGA